MKVTKRKRKERRLRILEKSVERRHAHEARVASGIRRDRAKAHRENLVNKYIDAKVELRKERAEALTQRDELLGRGLWSRIFNRRP